MVSRKWLDAGGVGKLSFLPADWINILPHSDRRTHRYLFILTMDIVSVHMHLVTCIPHTLVAANVFVANLLLIQLVCRWVAVFDEHTHNHNPVPPIPEQVAISFPQKNRMGLFKGNRYHGVMVSYSLMFGFVFLLVYNLLTPAFVCVA